MPRSFSSLTRPLSAATRLLPAAALALSVMGGGPAEAATGTVATSSGGDLSLVLGTTSVNPVAVGQNVIVGLNITNTSSVPIGPFTYTVVVSNAKLVPPTGGCSRTGGNTATCTFNGALQPGLTQSTGSWTVTPLAAGTVDVNASVAPAPLAAPFVTSSVDLVLQAIVGTADLQLVQTASTNSPTAGAPMTFNLQVKNSGPNTASSVVLTDTIQNDAVVLAATASNGAPCSIATGAIASTVTCSLGDMASASQVNVKVDALAPSVISGTFVETGNVSSPTYDPNTGNNTSSVSIKTR